MKRVVGTVGVRMRAVAGDEEALEARDGALRAGEHAVECVRVAHAEQTRRVLLELLHELKPQRVHRNVQVREELLATVHVIPNQNTRYSICYYM